MKRKNIIDTEVRTPAENARAFLHTLCISFTTIMVVSLAIVTIFATDEARQEIMWCWSLFGSCVCAAALQFEQSSRRGQVEPADHARCDDGSPSHS